MKKKLLITLMLLLLLLVLLQFDLYSLIDSIKQIPLWSVALLLSLQIGSQLLVTLQWQQMIKSLHTPISFRQMFYINCQGAVIDAITPGVKFGGEVTRCLQISRTCNCSRKQAATVVALQKLFSLSTFFFINLFTLGYLLQEASLIYGVPVLFLGFFSSIFVMPRQLKALIQTKCPSKGKDFLLTLLDHVIFLRTNTKTWIRFLLLSLLIWLLYPLKMYLLAIQIAPDLQLISVGAIAFVAYMVGMLPLFPGGLGGFEGTMLSLFLAIGLISSEALTITILFRFMTFWFVMLLSLLVIAFYKLVVKGVAP